VENGGCVDLTNVKELLGHKSLRDNMGDTGLEPVKLAIKNVGGFFGEYSLIDSKPSSASIIATQPGELVKITNTDLDVVLKKNDRIAKTIYRNVLQVLVRRLRNINKEYDMIYLV
jgi:hypothetical protein